MSERPPQLAHLEHLGDAARFATQLHTLIPKCTLLENFTPDEVRELSQFMEVYRAPEGAEIIRESDGGDFMVMVIEGRIEVSKRDRWNTPQRIATVEPGRILGEMSMIDGAARFATCTAAGGPALVAVLGRESLARTIVERPMLGAKLLMELVLMLSQRLRVTSDRLIEVLEEQGHPAAGQL